MSRAASGLVRALIDRAGESRNRIFLTEIRSVEWQSLIFTGERHLVTLRFTGPDAKAVAASFLDGLAEAEFSIHGSIVADVSAGPPVADGETSVLVEIEALTVEE